ncbi:oxidoreductase [Massilia psychrophila]|uniref:NADH:flavin oxidoreductase/NADH oxidase N-terminal domain-containing protein n=1 Tax=Massilia psychrophila TaxID=1603353 RepID=A0A2G8T523_9BURK|nr:hypothetical protein CR103_03115 [Massilia psychrophila]
MLSHLLIRRWHRTIKDSARAKAAGSDGVEIHDANGYLPDQFMTLHTNRRTGPQPGAPAGRGEPGRA